MAIALALAVLIAVATLTPTEATTGAQRMWCLVCGELGTLDFLLNLLLFVPFGAALYFAGMAPLRAIALAAALSLGVELLQLRVVTGRDASLGDLLSNTLGGALGVFLAARWGSVVRPSPFQAQALSVGSALFFLGVVAATALLTRPARPNGWLVGQYAPRWGAKGGFRGMVLHAQLSGTPLPIGVIRPGNAIAERFHGDSVVLDATLIPSPPTSKLTPLVGVGVPYQGKVIVLSQKGSDLRFYIRLRAGTIRLRSPTLRLTDAFADSTPSIAPVRATGGFARHELFARVGEGRGRALVVPRTVGLGWTMFAPTEMPIVRAPLLRNGFWVALLLFLPAYWGVFAIGMSVFLRGVALALLLVGGLVVAPAALALHATPAAEWVGALAGIALAIVLARRARPR